MKPIRNIGRSIKKTTQHLFVSGDHNGHRPALLTGFGAMTIIGLFALLIASSVFDHKSLVSNQSLLSQVYPQVVATLTNEARNEISVSTLAYSETLERAAEAKAQDMVSRGYFAHKSPDGRMPWDWIKQSGYQYEYAGENLAINFSESVDVYRAWMGSPTHRANLLNAHFTEIGIAVATTTVQGRESVLVVQMFGSPKKSYPKASVSAAPAINEATSTASTTEADASTTTVLGAVIADPQINEPLAVSTESPATQEQEPSSVVPEMIIDADANGSTAFIGGVASPRNRVVIAYAFFIVLLNIAMISFGYAEYRKHHIKQMWIALLVAVVCTALVSGYLYLYAPLVLL